jgi:tetratricopeptide (TPR) repeat protein
MFRLTAYIFFLLFFVIGCQPVFAGNIDSLFTSLNGQPAFSGSAKDTVRAKTLVNIASHYAQNADEKALPYIAELKAWAEKYRNGLFTGRVYQLHGQLHYMRHELKLSIENYSKAAALLKMAGDKKEYGKVLNNLGLSLSEAGENERAIQTFKEAVQARRDLNDSAGISKTLNNLGMAYMEAGDYNKSIENLQKSITIDNVLGNTRGIGTSYTNLGNTYSQIDQSDEALKCYKRALECFLKIDDKKRIGNSYNNIGTVYQKIKKYDEAEEYHKKALEIRREINDEKGLASTYTNLGIVENYKGNFTGALPFLEKAMELKEKFGDPYSKISTLNSLAETNLKLLRIAAAEKYIKRALEMGHEINAPGQLKDLYQRASEISEAKGDMKASLDYLRRSIAIKDSLFHNESYKKIAEMEAKFHNEEKQKEIEFLTVENQMQELSEKRKKIIIWIISVAGLISLALVVIAVRGNLQKKKANLDLERKNREVNEKNEEITVQKMIIEEKNKDILDSIQYAKRIQEGILPDVELFKAFLPDSFILFLPKDIVSGDFYWCEPVKGNKAKGIDPEAGVPPAFLFASCDCTGHGVPGAFVTFLGYNALNRCVNEFGLTKPSEILDQMNLLVEETFSKSNLTVNDGMDISLCMIQPAENGESILHYAGANNPLYVIRRDGNEVSVFQPDNQPIGRHITKKSFTNHEVKLAKGDMVFLFSDGYADQFGGEKGKKFKYSRLRDLLLQNKNYPMERMGETLKDIFIEWKGSLEQVDDICVIGVRV